MKAIAALAIGVALIALAAVVFLAPRPSAQTVALEPIEATPQRVDTPTTTSQASPQSTPDPAPTVKPVEPLEPRDATPPSSPSAVDELPEPSERPSDVQEASVSSDPEPTTTATPPTPTPAPSSLPVRQTAQGWGVQAGAFKTETNAVALRDRLLKAGLAARVESGEGGLYRVFVGAYSSADAARASVSSVVAALR